MARGIHQLTTVSVAKAKPGNKKTKRGDPVRALYCDGGGLWLQVTRGRTDTKEIHRSWLYRWTIKDTVTGKTKTREMGLGSLKTIGLAQAREKARIAREQRLEGIDPLEKRRAEASATAGATAKAMTFDQCAHAFIEAHRDSWHNPKHRAQWGVTLRKYASPVFGKLPVQAVDLPLVLKVIEPLWKNKRETASRVRGRVEKVLNWAAVRGYRTGENPARWRGHLDNLLPARKRSDIVHHSALPYAGIGGFMQRLRERDGTTARALEFLILSAARTGEVIGAEWKEFDLAAKIWIIPAQRMKARQEHRVPLSPRAVEIIEEMQTKKRDRFVFPGVDGKVPLSNMAMAELLKRMGDDEITVHGFRSTFRDWASETTAFPHEICEMALAHKIANKAEAAYRRGDVIEKRRKLMAAWAGYCAKPASTGANVVSLQAGA